ncbi:MAG: type II toxin-antitoxin system Phd/YefM family antitoxin [Oscillibacter sp.]|nr:type II toxin-antitoxin system Phd/YefM family antitoxin [Oscillibacter sp.]
MMETLSPYEFSKGAGKYLTNVMKNHEHYQIIDGDVSAVLISASEYEALKEYATEVMLKNNRN